jgi:two-component system phosphate regulon sensor histidine kinase PhoR
MGDIDLHKHNVNINTLIDTVFTTLRDKAVARGLVLKKALPSEPFEIRADRDKLIQILLNLVDNGIKFTDAGGVTVGMEREEGRTILFVEDTGMGIPKKHLPRLGERFYRVDKARSRELGGTGLGLAIVKHLVKALEWNMEIESTQGRGTKVKILISENSSSA